MLCYLYLCAIGIFWGGSFIAIKYAVDGIPSTTAAALRVAIAWFTLAILFWATGKPMEVQKDRRWKVWLTGLFAQSIPFAALFWAEKSVSPGFAGLVNGTMPLWVFLLTLLFLKKREPVSGKLTIGLALAAIGILTIYVPMLQTASTLRELLAMGAVFVMVISYAIGTLLSRSLLMPPSPVNVYANTFQQHTASLLMLIPLCLFFDHKAIFSGQLAHLTWVQVASVAYLGICSTALAFLMYFHLLREWGSVRASAVTYLIPPMALLFDLIFFGNTPSPNELVGGAFVLAGVFLIQAPKVSNTVSVPRGSLTLER